MDTYQRFNPNSGPPPGPPPPQPPPSSHDQLQQPPPVPPQSQWYAGQQHQYQPTPQHPLPPPPPPPGSHHQYPPPPQPHPLQQQQWAPQGYPPPPGAYPNQLQQQQHYPVQQYPSGPPPPPHHPPPPFYNSQVPPQSYSSAGHQGWGNPNWTHHQGYGYPGQGNEDDWAARARAWAASKCAMENQQQQPAYPQAARPESQTQYHDQYAYVADPQVSYGNEKYQHVSLSNGQAQSASGALQFGPGSISSEPLSSGPDSHQTKDGSLAEATIRQQEVPSSYSSTSGGDITAGTKHISYTSFPVPSNMFQSGQHTHTMMPPVDQPGFVDRSYSYHNQNDDLADKPLEFVPRANPEAMYSHPGTVYPSVINSGSQFDASKSAQSPVPGQVAPLFAAMPGPNFQPSIPSSTAPYGPGAGASLVSSTAFPIDPFGNMSDRPKKASVPNWLKEEIIKKKAVMATSVYQYPKDEIQSAEEENGYHTDEKDEQADSESMDTFRSADEEDDEDAEAARNAAINQEIRRVVTEVLMKVTDDLFDEIATKVLTEDDITTEAATTQPSANVLVPVKSNRTNTEAVTTNSVLPGALLGLASYDTDSEDDEDETQGANMANPGKGSNGTHVTGNGDHSLNEKSDDDTTDMERSDGTSSSKITNKNSIIKTLGNEVTSGIEDGQNKKRNSIVTSDLMNIGDKQSIKHDHNNLSSLDEIAHEGKMVSGRKEAVTERVGDIKIEDYCGGKQEEKLPNNGKSIDHNVSKDRKKEGSWSEEKQRETISRKQSSRYEEEEEEKENGRGKKAGRGEDRGRGHTDDDRSARSRHKHSSESDRQKRRRSPSPSSRRRNKKTDSSVSDGSDTNDESLNDSKRKLKSKRRIRSPSPVRSRKRQVSRSPEHSQRRHSPYYSHESSRKRRSRSRSARLHS